MSLSRETLFSPIPLCSITPSMLLDFNLYVKKEKEFHLIVEKGDLYPAKLSENLRRLHHTSDYFYIHNSEKLSYYKHIESYLKKISRDNTLSLEEKSFFIYKNTENTMRDILNSPYNQESLIQIKFLIDATIDMVLNHDTSIQSLINLCSNNYHTYTHSVDVCIFAIGFADYLGYSFEKLNNVAYAAMMHDIGKSKIPNEILDKKGKLNEEEFFIIRNHSLYGYELLKSYGETNEDILMGVRSHHEKKQGNGYPDGLKLHAINDIAKIISVCDIFSALTSERSYKSAFSTYEALQLMKKEMLCDLDQTLFYDFVRFIGKSLARKI